MQSARLIKSAEEIAWFEKGGAFHRSRDRGDRQNLRPACQRTGSPHIHNAVLKDGGSLMFHFLGCTPMDDPEFIFPWQYPSTRIVQRGDILMTEISAGYWGYCGQIQRPFAVAGAPSPEYQSLYDLATECYGASSPPQAGRDRRRHPRCRGLHRDFRLPHPRRAFARLGVTIEPPRADLGVAMIKRELLPFTVEPGMLFVIQPHVVSADGKRGVQVGNLVVCEEIGARSLQKAPMDSSK